ncbi:MAG: SAM-dependent methyltransferase [Chitinophagaceae bacterium]|nr:SAM-dependent methyltransferase [Chitinophagaceae bacterium]
MLSTVYLIPSLLEESAFDSLTPSILTAIKQCKAFFVEDERTARRFLKSIWKEMVIDDYEWFLADKTSLKANQTPVAFRDKLKKGIDVGIISEAGCPGVADPGQTLIAIAHQQKAKVKPIVGPSSILLALMASGMNGQRFNFFGYLAIDNGQRVKDLREIESESAKKDCTQIFMETPYRNMQLLETVMKTCRSTTKLCIASNLTGPDEFILTQTIEEWKKNLPNLHKRPTMFVLQAEGV